MPFDSNSDLPDAVKVLPSAAQTIFRRTFNSVFNKFGEEKSFKVAWSAVKSKFHKVKGKWESKSLDEIKSEDEETKAGYVPKVGLQHEHVLKDRGILSRGKIVNSKKVIVDDDAALYLDTVLNKAHPDFESLKSSIEEGFIDSFSMEFKTEESETMELPIGEARFLDKFQFTGETYTGKPVHSGCKITEYFEDEGGQYHVKGYGVRSGFDTYNDYVTENAIDYVNTQIQTAIAAKSDDIAALHLNIKNKKESINDRGETMTEEVKEVINGVDMDAKPEAEAPAEEPKKEEAAPEAEAPKAEVVEEAPAEEKPAEEAPATEEPKAEEEPAAEAKSLDADEVKAIVKEALKGLVPEQKALVNSKPEEAKSKEKPKEEIKSIADYLAKKEFKE